MPHTKSTSVSTIKPLPRPPLLSRPLDCIYVAWFAIHLLVMFCVDLVPLYPSSFRPAVLLALREWYINTYRDKFFVDPPAWFAAYIGMEALYHVPLSAWAIGGLIRDDPLVPLHLMIWSVQAALTTFTCMAEYTTWIGYSSAEKWALTGLYGPYLAIAVFMGADMFTRLRERLYRAASLP